MADWRLLIEEGDDPAWNMAVDEALLHSDPHLRPPTLRLYGWRVPTLSLGYFQSLADVDLAACRAAGVEVVRRSTGGRAVLHHDEVTYSVVAGIDRFAPGVAASFRQLSRVLIDAVSRLGLEARLQRTHAQGRSAVCFDTPAFAELTVAGKKVIGSAQTRTKHALLQHGSVPLTMDWPRLQAALGLSETELRRVRRRADGLAAFTGVDRSQVRQALLDAFAAHAGPLVAGPLTDEERERARALAETKYAPPSPAVKEAVDAVGG